MDTLLNTLRRDPLGRDATTLLLALDALGGTATLTGRDGDRLLGDRPIADHAVRWTDEFGLIEPDPDGSGRITLTDHGRAHLRTLEHPRDRVPVDEHRQLFVIGNALIPQRRLAWRPTGEGNTLPLSLRRRGNDARLTPHQLQIEVDWILHTLRERYLEVAAESGPSFDEVDFDPWRHAGDLLAAFPEAALAAVFGSLQDGEGAG